MGSFDITFGYVIKYIYMKVERGVTSSTKGLPRGKEKKSVKTSLIQDIALQRNVHTAAFSINELLADPRIEDYLRKFKKNARFAVKVNHGVKSSVGASFSPNYAIAHFHLHNFLKHRYKIDESCIYTWHACILINDSIKIKNPISRDQIFLFVQSYKLTTSVNDSLRQLYSLGYIQKKYGNYILTDRGLAVSRASYTFLQEFGKKIDKITPNLKKTLLEEYELKRERNKKT